MPPRTLYADRGGSALAFQQFGQGSASLVLATEISGHLDLIWWALLRADRDGDPRRPPGRRPGRQARYELRRVLAPPRGQGAEARGDPRRARKVTRRLATVVVTDIVGSTELASRMGDERWRALLERHDTLVGRAVEQEPGALVKHPGDGTLSTFDGPAQAIRAARRLVDEAAAEDLAISP